MQFFFCKKFNLLSIFYYYFFALNSNSFNKTMQSEIVEEKERKGSPQKMLSV